MGRRATLAIIGLVALMAVITGVVATLSREPEAALSTLETPSEGPSATHTLSNPTPTASVVSLPAVKAMSESTVRHNEDVFFSRFTRSDLDTWGEQNLIDPSDVDFSLCPRCNAWRFPDGNDGPIASTQTPQLSALDVSDPIEYWFVGVDLGLYQTGGRYILALGFMPHPKLVPVDPEGNPEDRFVAFFEVSSTSSTRYATGKAREVDLKHLAGLGWSRAGEGVLIRSWTQKQYVRHIIANVGHVACVNVLVGDLKFGGIATLGLQGKRRALWSLLHRIEMRSGGWIHLRPGLPLPNQAVLVGGGFQALDGSPPILPGLST